MAEVINKMGTESAKARLSHSSSESEIAMQLRREVGHMSPSERAELYLRKLARLSQDIVSPPQDSESRASLRRIELLMTEADIDFTPCPDRSLSLEEHRELHRYQQLSVELGLIDRLVKAGLSYCEGIAESRYLIAEAEAIERQIDKIYYSEQQVSRLVRWYAHWQNAPLLNKLSEEEAGLEISTCETVAQVENSLKIMERDLRAVIPAPDCFLKIRTQDAFHSPSYYLTWTEKYYAWAKDVFYDRPDVILLTVLRPQLAALRANPFQ